MIGPFKSNGLTYTWLALAYALCEDSRTSQVDKAHISHLHYIEFYESALPDVIHQHSYLPNYFPELPVFTLSPLLYILRQTYADPSGSVASSRVIKKMTNELTQIAKMYGWTLEQLLILWEREEQQREPNNQIPPEGFLPVFDLVVEAINKVKKEQAANPHAHPTTHVEIDKAINVFMRTGRDAFVRHYHNFNRHVYPYECNIERFKRTMDFMDPHYWGIKRLKPGVLSCLDLLPYTLTEMRDALKDPKRIGQLPKKLTSTTNVVDPRLYRIAEYLGGFDS